MRNRLIGTPRVRAILPDPPVTARRRMTEQEYAGEVLPQRIAEVTAELNERLAGVLPTRSAFRQAAEQGPGSDPGQ